MTTRRYDRVAYGQPLKDLLQECVERPAVMTITDVEKREGDGALLMTVVITEEPGHDRWRKECEGPGCDVVWFAESPRARYHDGACRVRAFRAQQRQTAQETIDAVHDLAVAEDTPR